MTDEELEVLQADTEEYASLITQENYKKPKYNLLARSALKPGVDLINLLQGFPLDFNVDNAAGDQLDILGDYLGLYRLLEYKPASGSREMDDDEYRISLKLAIARNTWDGSLCEVERIYKNVLGEEFNIIYIDNQNMTVSIKVYGDVPTRVLEIFEHSGLLLLPVGVGKTVQTVGGNADITLGASVGISSLEQVEQCNAN